MSGRPLVRYGERRTLRCRFDGLDPDQPRDGLYQMRLRSGGVFVPVRIWHGAPLDPATGDDLDRAPRWNAQLNGEVVDIDVVWPRCAGDRISAEAYAYLLSRRDWAVDHAPDTALADPTRKVDPLTSPLLF